MDNGKQSHDCRRIYRPFREGPRPAAEKRARSWRRISHRLEHVGENRLRCSGSDFAKDKDFLKVKCGYLEQQSISPAEVQALADLPPLPVVRAALLGTLMAPANQLARVLSEPGRQIAAVLNAYTDKEAAAEAG